MRPCQRLTAAHAPIGHAPNLMEAVIPQVEHVVASVRELDRALAAERALAAREPGAARHMHALRARQSARPGQPRFRPSVAPAPTAPRSRARSCEAAASRRAVSHHAAYSSIIRRLGVRHLDAKLAGELGAVQHVVLVRVGEDDVAKVDRRRRDTELGLIDRDELRLDAEHLRAQLAPSRGW